jgi:hypothetical protein
MKPKIPDLRHDHQEFTLDHCSVLLYKLGKLLDSIELGDNAEAADQMDAVQMREDLLSLWTPQQLSVLFDSEIGKGLIIGVFFTHFVLPITLETE